jgi:hypothetical protein
MDGTQSDTEINFLTQQMIQLQEVYEQRLTKKDDEIEQLKVDLSDTLSSNVYSSDVMSIDQLSQTINELRQTETEYKHLIDGLKARVLEITKENSELKQIIQRMTPLSNPTGSTVFGERPVQYPFNRQTPSITQHVSGGQVPDFMHDSDTIFRDSLYDRHVSQKRSSTRKSEKVKKIKEKSPDPSDPTPRCAGYTGSGEKCKNPSITGNRFCHAHQKSRTCKGITDKGSPCKNTCLPDREFCIHHQRMSKRCTHTLTSGERCKNISHGGSSKCSRHLAL